jgi:hypothetical protein
MGLLIGTGTTKEEKKHKEANAGRHRRKKEDILRQVQLLFIFRELIIGKWCRVGGG